MLADGTMVDWQIDPAVPIARQICRVLREQIIRNHLHPDQKISEAEIAIRYGISRQPVREAFIRLSQEGLVAVLPQRGTRVCRIDVAAVREARFVREAVETDIVRLLTEEPSDISDLRAHVDRQWELVGGDHQAFIEADEAFHLSLARLAGQPGLWSKIQGMKSQMDRVRFLSLGQFPMRQLVEQHAGIVEGIASGNAAAATAAMRRHLRQILSDLPQVVATNPDFFDPAPHGGAGRIVTIEGGED